MLEAIKKLVENNIGILPVTSKGILVAVFSEKDAIRALAVDEMNRPTVVASVKDILKVT